MYDHQTLQNKIIYVIEHPQKIDPPQCEQPQNTCCAVKFQAGIIKYFMTL